MRAITDNGRCPYCKDRVLQKSGSATKLRIKGGVFFDDDGNASAQCHWCKERVGIPLILEKSDVEEETLTVSTSRGSKPNA